ncbi:MAG: hypothetical protein ACHBNF_01515, partial [Chromatiales bacterium]
MPNRLQIELPPSDHAHRGASREEAIKRRLQAGIAAVMTTAAAAALAADERPSESPPRDVLLLDSMGRVVR